MKDRTTKNWLLASIIANVSSYIEYSLFATFALLTFGRSVGEDFLNMYEVEDPFAIVARGSIMISTVSSYPILCFVVCNVIEDNLCAMMYSKNNSNSFEPSYLRYFSIKSIFFLVTLFCMLFAKGMSQVFVFSGILASFSTLALPGVLMIKTCDEFRSPIAKHSIHLCGYLTLIANFLFITGYIYTVWREA